MGKSHEISLFATVSHGCEGKKYSLQPLLMVAKDFLSFATVTDSCEDTASYDVPLSGTLFHIRSGPPNL